MNVRLVLFHLFLTREEIVMLRLLASQTALAPPFLSLPFSPQRTWIRINRRAPVWRREIAAAALPSGLEKWRALAVDETPTSSSSSSSSSSLSSSSSSEPPPLTSDPDYLANLDDLCTRALRAMLKGDIDSLKPGSPWADDVSALGNYCVSARQPPHLDGARFAFFLLEIAANRWPAEADDLVGVYKDASEKIHGLLVDSGWRLALPGEKEDDSGVAGGYDELLEEIENSGSA